MLRRTFLSVAGATGLSGLFEDQTGTATTPTTETDAQPDDQSDTETDLHESDHTWRGEPSSASLLQAGVRLDGTDVRVLDAQVGTQVGILTAADDYTSADESPNERFEWYTPSDGEYLWFVELHVGDETDPPPVENWGVPRPTGDTLSDGTTPYAATADETPEYYRLSDSWDGTQPAYTNTQDRRNSRLLLFEHPWEAVDVFYGDPPQAAWKFYHS
ncbi:hypothetical protein [Haloarcula sp. JP-L23]|uniref:hypothetical protein n=1 Tax=Haloarcula sp. JP-L23 TaxID=2716717 RepID=UPI00140EC837|nr:hypothetical protein G9465_24475 [Haloarcula sp. JP-L23]